MSNGETQGKEAKKQGRMLKQAKKKAEKELEAQELIEAGRKPRGAKTKALENRADWVEYGKRSRKVVDSGTTDVPAGHDSVGSKKRKKGEDETSGTTKKKIKSKNEGKKDKKGAAKPPNGRSKHSKRPTGKSKGKSQQVSGSSDESESADDSESEASDTSANHSESDSSSEASSVDSEEESDDGALGEMSENELRDTLANEVSQVVVKQQNNDIANIWELNEQNVEVVPRSSSPSRGSGTSSSTGASSQAPHTHTSSSSKPAPAPTSFAAKSDSESSESPPPRIIHSGKSSKSKKHSKKPNLTSSKREETFRKEHPRVVRGKPDNDAKVTKKQNGPKNIRNQEGSQLDSDPNDDSNEEAAVKWPAHARLSGIGLKQQNMYIRALCYESITIIEKDIITKHAWPELNRMREYQHEVFMKALKRLQKQDDAYKDIRDRIKMDMHFVKTLGKLTMDRLPHARGAARTKGLNHIAIFQLGVGTTCKERVHALIKSDTYIYSGRWDVDEQGKPTWVVKKNEIYLNEGLVNVIKSGFFATTLSFGHKYKEYYVSSHPTRLEPEFPASLVALAATGLYAGLHAWKNGIKNENEKFQGDIFNGVFERHMSYLKSMKDQNPIGYHGMMSALYSKVMEGSQKDTDDIVHGNPLAIVDLSEFI